MRRPRASLLLLVALQLAICAWFSRFALIDDAYIAFRYAANFAAGHGLVFNVGERVEGYTCFLWVVLLAGAALVRVDLGVASQLLGAACLAATLVVTARSLPRDPERPAASALVAPALLATNAASALWAVHGLETALFGLLLVLGVRADLRALEGAPAAAGGSALGYALATLTRPEAAALFAASLLFAGLASRRAPADARLGRRIAIFAAIVLPHVLWRWHYYGDLLPNTFYAKVGVSLPLVARGAGYVAEFFTGAQALVFLPILAAASAARRDRRVRCLLWMLAVFLALVALEGGDAFPAWRFLVPIFPVLYLLVQAGSDETLRARRGAGAVRRRLLAIGLALAVLAAPFHVRRVFEAALVEARGADRFTRDMTLVGVCLGRHLAPSARIALNPAGAVPYHSGLYAYDMLGLTNAHIAHRPVSQLGAGFAGHEKGDGAYILDEKPDVILMGNVQIVPTRLSDLSNVHWNETLLSEHEIARDPRTPELYVADQLPLGDGRHLLFLRRRDVVVTRD